MMATSKDYIVRRRYVKHVLQTVSLACTVFGASLACQSLEAHGPNCGCDSSVNPGTVRHGIGQQATGLPAFGHLSHGKDWGAQGCSSGQCGSCSQCEAEEGVISVPVQTRKLSFAERLLRKMDKVGDSIEANLLPLPPVHCTTCGPGPGANCSEATCGVEIGEPSRGLEYANPVDGEVYYEDEVYLEDSEYGSTETAPVPNKPSTSPKSSQLEPVPQSKPAAPKPAQPAPAPQVKPAPQATQQEPPAGPPKLELPPSEDFTPRRPNPGPSQLNPVPSGPKSTAPSLPPAAQNPAPVPTEPPTLRVPEVKDPIRIPAPNTPQLPTPRLPTPQSPTPQSPTPLNNLPDILVDPFQDDLSFQHRRNRMNGMEASNRTRIQEANQQRQEISRNSSSRMPASGTTAQRVPARAPSRDRISDTYRGSNNESRTNSRSEVTRASAEEPVHYNQHPQTPQQRQPVAQGQIQQISHQEPLNAPIYDRPSHEGEPRVNRVAVPHRR